jgi:hypothetical protein
MGDGHCWSLLARCLHTMPLHGGVLDFGSLLLSCPFAWPTPAKAHPLHARVLYAAAPVAHSTGLRGPSTRTAGSAQASGCSSHLQRTGPWVVHQLMPLAGRGAAVSDHPPIQETGRVHRSCDDPLHMQPCAGDTGGAGCLLASLAGVACIRPQLGWGTDNPEEMFPPNHWVVRPCLTLLLLTSTAVITMTPTASSSVHCAPYQDQPPLMPKAGGGGIAPTHGNL